MENTENDEAVLGGLASNEEVETTKATQSPEDVLKNILTEQYKAELAAKLERLKGMVDAIDPLKRPPKPNYVELMEIAKIVSTVFADAANASHSKISKTCTKANANIFIALEIQEAILKIIKDSM